MNLLTELRGGVDEVYGFIVDVPAVTISPFTTMLEHKKIRYHAN